MSASFDGYSCSALCALLKDVIRTFAKHKKKCFEEQWALCERTDVQINLLCLLSAQQVLLGAKDYQQAILRK